MVTHSHFFWSDELAERECWLQLVVLVEEPNSKKCIINGDNWSVKRPTKFLYNLNAEVVLMTVWGVVCPNLWAIYGLP